MQRDLIYKPSVTGFVGFWTNRLFNKEPPDTLIWNNANTYVGVAERAVRQGNLGPAYANLIRARHFYLAALKEYLTWKEGIEGAVTKMEVAIGVGAALAVTAFIAPAIVTAIVERPSSAAAAVKLAMRISTTITEADEAIQAADAVSVEEEIQAEAKLEAEISAWR